MGVLLVLIAVCSLTISVVTRYSSSESAPVYKAGTLHNLCSPEGIRQRLTKAAASWLPPVISAVILTPPASYSRPVSSRPRVQSRIFAAILYNRPPPRS